jgi:hypothetical protein
MMVNEKKNTKYETTKINSRYVNVIGRKRNKEV